MGQGIYLFLESTWGTNVALNKK